MKLLARHTDIERCGTFHSFLTAYHSHSERGRERGRERERGRGKEREDYLLTTSTA